jgi:hypothetical protein
MFLDCNGVTKHPPTIVETHSLDCKLTYTGRYAISSLSFEIIEIRDPFDNIIKFL